MERKNQKDTGTKLGAILRKASLKGDKKTITKLLENYSKQESKMLIEEEDENCRDCLFYAVASKNLEMVKMIDKFGCNPLKKDNSGMTPLHIASFNGSFDILLYYDEFIEKEKRDEEEIIEIKEKNEIDQNDQEKDLKRSSHSSNLLIDNQGSTLLHKCTHQGNRAIVRWLIKEKNYCVDRADSNGSSALHLAALKGHLEIVKDLINFGAKVDQVNNVGASPLHFASFNGYCDVIKHLLISGCDIDILDNFSTSPLHIACRDAKSEVCSVLCKLGANVNLQDKDGSTPLM